MKKATGWNREGGRFFSKIYSKMERMEEKKREM